MPVAGSDGSLLRLPLDGPCLTMRLSVDSGGTGARGTVGRRVTSDQFFHLEQRQLVGFFSEGENNLHFHLPVSTPTHNLISHEVHTVHFVCMAR